MTDRTVFQALRMSPTFGELTTRQLRRVAELGEVREVEAGTPLPWHGPNGDVVYLVIKGRATVTRHGARVAGLGRGQVFGEVGVPDHAPHQASVHARTAMTLIRFTAETFGEILDEHPAVRTRIEAEAAARRTIERRAC